MARGFGRRSFAVDLRRALPLFSLTFGLVAAITQPSTPGDLILVAVPVAAWTLWALAANVPLVAVSPAIVLPVVVAQRSGELEPAMFNACLLAFAAARWSRSLATAVSLGVLAATTPVLVALIQDPMEVAVAVWIIGIAFSWVIGRAVLRQARLVEELESMRRQLAQQARLDERRRIARDVHDFVGHTLAALMLHVTGARHVLRREPDAAEEALRSAEGMGRRSMDELRRTLALLRSEDEDGLRPPLPSVAEIGSLVEQAGSAGLAVEFQTRGDLNGVPSGVGVAVYRIAHEALANAAQHAPHARTVVSLEVVAGQVCLDANTTGPISGVDGGRAHYGLVGMRERATALGGELGAGPTADGWRVRCRIPLRLGDDSYEGGAPTT